MPLTNPLHGIMNANRLIDTSFTNWLKNLKILPQSERITYVLDGDSLVDPASNAYEDEVWEYQKWPEDSTTLQYYMLASMCNNLQRQHEDMELRTMLLHLMELFAEQSRT